MELLCTYSGVRRVNNREAKALEYTFGKDVGKFLIDTIEIEYSPDLAKGDKRGYFLPVRSEYPYINASKIKMRSDYNPENLRWLGVFIHETAHAWQANTWKHLGVATWWKVWGDYDYNREQLVSVELGREEFPSAVQDWFYVKYGIKSGLIGKKNQVSSNWVWNRIIDALGQKYESERSTKQAA